MVTGLADRESNQMDPAMLAELRVPSGEMVTRMPAAVIPELRCGVYLSVKYEATADELFIQRPGRCSRGSLTDTALGS
jgi:hypothetical protein